MDTNKKNEKYLKIGEVYPITLGFAKILEITTKGIYVERCYDTDKWDETLFRGSSNYQLIMNQIEKWVLKVDLTM